MKITQAMKRKLIQIAAFGFSNSHISNMKTGSLYQGSWKQFCNPGMNCYSCPAASLSCPIGALQSVAGSMEFQFSFYVVGFILAVGVILGRWICGFLCPFGLLQEILHKIPFPKFKLPRVVTYLKYILLAVFVVWMPAAVTDFMGIGKPAFCQYICPVGTLEGGIPLLITHEELFQTIGALFSLKMVILYITILGCISVYRFFCKAMCPLGAVYGLLNKISVYHLEVDEKKCVHCGKCAQICLMDVDPVKKPNSPECIRCGACKEVCPANAIQLKFGRTQSTKI